jgi:hypothetical protein
MLMALAQIGVWIWQLQQPDAEKYRATGNPFISRTWQLSHLIKPNQIEVQTNRPRLDIPRNNTNLVLKDPQGSKTVTILTDPVCTPCREQVNAWLRQIPAQGVRVKVKFWPADPQRLIGGMALALAQRFGVQQQIWETWQRDTSTVYSDADLLILLGEKGVPLLSIRQALEINQSPLLQTLEPDLVWAQSNKLPPPPVLLVDGEIVQ